MNKSSFFLEAAVDLIPSKVTVKERSQFELRETANSGLKGRKERKCELTL